MNFISVTAWHQYNKNKKKMRQTTKSSMIVNFTVVKIGRKKKWITKKRKNCLVCHDENFYKMLFKFFSRYFFVFNL